MEKYEKKGYMTGPVGAVVMLITGVGISILVLIFVGALGGQTYNLVEPKIDNISDAEIKASVKSGVKSGFSALQQTGDYLPIIVLAIVIAIVLALVMGIGTIGGRGESAL